VIITATTQAPFQTTVGTSSAFDSSPFAGADFIGSGRAFCTSGFGVSITGSRHVVTAGHCGVDPWNNYTSLDGQTPYGSGHTLGTSYSDTWNTPADLDQMLLPATGTPQMWVGNSYKADHTAVVKASLNPPVGAQVCPNGAFEGTACYGTVQSSPYNGCTTIQEGTATVKTCHVFEAKQPSGQVIVGEGDSGGPVVIPTYTGQTITSVKVAGVITGEHTEKKTCPQFAWRGKVCSDTVIWTGSNAILNYYNATLLTG
jgi:hypothetical protein